MANLITLDEYKTAKKITGFGDDVRLEAIGHFCESISKNLL